MSGLRLVTEKKTGMSNAFGGGSYLGTCMQKH